VGSAFSSCGIGLVGIGAVSATFPCCCCLVWCGNDCCSAVEDFCSVTRLTCPAAPGAVVGFKADALTSWLPTCEDLCWERRALLLGWGTVCPAAPTVVVGVSSETACEDCCSAVEDFCWDDARPAASGMYSDAVARNDRLAFTIGLNALACGFNLVRASLFGSSPSSRIE